MSDSKARTDFVHYGFILFIAACYLFFYFAHPALPGNSQEYPLGWWGWFDQGKYLEAAKAASNFDFTSSHYFYPPLYPLLGAFLVRWNSMHAFTVLDLSCFLLFAHYFVRFAKEYVGWAWSVALFVGAVFTNWVLVQVWIEPWTSTLVAALYAYAFSELNVYFLRNTTPSIYRVGFLGICGGMVFATRPVDSVALLPLYTLVVCKTFLPENASRSFNENLSGSLESAVTLIACASIGLVGFFGFNLLVHGSIFGSYLSVAQSNGFHPYDILEKFISIFFDSGSLYNVPEESILSRVKWCAIAVPALIYGLASGNLVIRALVCVLALQILLYFPYSDLMPTGVWRFHNIHYFKWFFPYAALLILMLVKAGFKAGNRGKSFWASLIVGGLCLLLRVELNEIERITVEPSSSTGTLSIASHKPDMEIDKISIPALQGDFTSVYFGRNLAVSADGKVLKWGFVTTDSFQPHRVWICCLSGQ